MLPAIHPRSAESKYRLLYLGSDSQFVETLNSALKEPDYKLVTCGNESDALLFLKSLIPYDLLIIDFEWKPVEGLKVARATRAVRHRKRMPIVLVSASELNKSVLVSARQSGIDECVVKIADDVVEVIKKRIDPRKSS